MAEPTQAELETMIANIDTQLAILTAYPERAVDYRVGGLSYANSQKIDNLKKVREMYQTKLDAFPSEDFQRYAIDVDDTGRDQTEYLGDSGE